MAESLSPLQYGTVVGRFLVELGDSNDADLKPDVYPARGQLLFTPSVSYANVKTAQPDPATIFPQAVYGVLDSEGYLCSVEVDDKGVPRKTVDGAFIPSQRGLRIQASSDPNISPTGWTWRVAFSLNFSGISLPYEAYSFTLDPNQTVDLAYVKPVSSSTGTITITGPKGEQGLQGPKGETGPVNVLSIGTVTTSPTGSSATATITGNAPNQTLNFNLPQGPVGPSGGPIPAGGSTGQLITKNSAGGYEWFTPSYDAPIAIGASVDLDTLTTPGDYHQSLNVNAADGINYPLPYAGILFVRSSGSFLYQYYNVYSSAGSNASKMFIRGKYGASAFTPWKTIQFSEDIPLASSSSPGFISTDQYTLLNSATYSANAGTLVQRNSSGESTHTDLFSTTTSQSTNERSFTKKVYVDSEIEKVRKYPILLTNLSTVDVNTLLTEGSYFIDGTSPNAPALCGLTFGGELRVVRTAGGGLARGHQTLTVTVVRPNGGAIADHGANGSDFFGITFTRGFISSNFYPWKMIGETKTNTKGITLDFSTIGGERVPIKRKIRNGNLVVEGTFDLATGVRTGDIFTLASPYAVNTKQVVAVTEAVGGWGKVQISGTVGRVYMRDPGVNWITFEGEWELTG